MGWAVGTVKAGSRGDARKLRGRLVQTWSRDAEDSVAVAAGAGRLAVPPALIEATVRYAMAGKLPGGMAPAATMLCFHSMGNGGNS